MSKQQHRPHLPHQPQQECLPIHIHIDPKSSSCTEAMASSLREIETCLQCSMCHQLLTDPSTLSCSHTFCLQCISNDKRWTCPECNMPVTLSGNTGNARGGKSYVTNPNLSTVVASLHNIVNLINSSTPGWWKCQNQASLSQASLSQRSQAQAQANRSMNDMAGPEEDEEEDEVLDFNMKMNDKDDDDISDSDDSDGFMTGGSPLQDEEDAARNRNGDRNANNNTSFGSGINAYAGFTIRTRDGDIQIPSAEKEKISRGNDSNDDDDDNGEGMDITADSMPVPISSPTININRNEIEQVKAMMTNATSKDQITDADAALHTGENSSNDSHSHLQQKVHTPINGNGNTASGNGNGNESQSTRAYDSHSDNDGGLGLFSQEQELLGYKNINDDDDTGVNILDQSCPIPNSCPNVSPIPMVDSQSTELFVSPTPTPIPLQKISTPMASATRTRTPMTEATAKAIATAMETSDSKQTGLLVADTTSTSGSIAVTLHSVHNITNDTSTSTKDPVDIGDVQTPNANAFSLSGNEKVTHRRRGKHMYIPGTAATIATENTSRRLSSESSYANNVTNESETSLRLRLPVATTSKSTSKSIGDSNQQNQQLTHRVAESTSISTISMRNDKTAKAKAIHAKARKRMSLSHSKQKKSLSSNSLSSSSSFPLKDMTKNVPVHQQRIMTDADTDTEGLTKVKSKPRSSETSKVKSVAVAVAAAAAAANKGTKIAREKATSASSSKAKPSQKRHLNEVSTTINDGEEPEPTFEPEPPLVFLLSAASTLVASDSRIMRKFLKKGQFQMLQSNNSGSEKSSEMDFDFNFDSEVDSHLFLSILYKNYTCRNDSDPSALVPAPAPAKLCYAISTDAEYQTCDGYIIPRSFRYLLAVACGLTIVDFSFLRKSTSMKDKFLYSPGTVKVDADDEAAQTKRRKRSRGRGAHSDDKKEDNHLVAGDVETMELLGPQRSRQRMLERFDDSDDADVNADDSSMTNIYDNGLLSGYSIFLYGEWDKVPAPCSSKDISNNQQMKRKSRMTKKEASTSNADADAQLYTRGRVLLLIKICGGSMIGGNVGTDDASAERGRNRNKIVVLTRTRNNPNTEDMTKDVSLSLKESGVTDDEIKTSSLVELKWLQDSIAEFKVRDLDAYQTS